MGMYNKEPIREFGLACEPGSSRTKQAFKNDCDINQILAKVQKTGMLEHLQAGEPFYGDVSDISDYKNSLDIVNKANGLFMEMSPEIRERFDNDPAKMIAFLEDENNRKEAIELGMVIERPTVTVQPVTTDSKGAVADAKQ